MQCQHVHAVYGEVSECCGETAQPTDPFLLDLGYAAGPLVDTADVLSKVGGLFTKDNSAMCPYMPDKCNTSKTWIKDDLTVHWKDESSLVTTGIITDFTTNLDGVSGTMVLREIMPVPRCNYEQFANKCFRGRWRPYVWNATQISYDQKHYLGICDTDGTPLTADEWAVVKATNEATLLGFGQLMGLVPVGITQADQDALLQAMVSYDTGPIGRASLDFASAGMPANVYYRQGCSLCDPDF